MSRYAMCPDCGRRMRRVKDMWGNWDGESYACDYCDGDDYDDYDDDLMHGLLCICHDDRICLRGGRHYCELLEGTQPIYDSKYKPFEDANFKEAMSYGPYVHPVRVRRNKNGVYETLGSDDVMGRILTDEKAIAYYRKEADKKDSGIHIYELTEDELLAVEIPKYDPEETARIREQQEIEMRKRLEEAEEKHVEAVVQMALEQKQEEYIRMLQENAEEIMPAAENGKQEKWNLDGDDLLELILQNLELLDDEQIRQIRLGWSNGLSVAQIKQYFTMPAERMKLIREFMEEKNEKEKTEIM